MVHAEEEAAPQFEEFEDAKGSARCEIQLERCESLLTSGAVWRRKGHVSECRGSGLAMLC